MRRIPQATYRLQLSAAFTLARVAELCDTFDSLGITHVYTSPIFTSTRGSPHGYDVLDPLRVDPELRGREALAELARELRRRGMALLVDVVPNHMAARAENPWWRDVLLHGQASAHAATFDIDWEAGGGKLHLPILGGELEELVRSGELAPRAARQAPGAFELVYHEHRFPLDLQGADAPPGDAQGLLALLERQNYRLHSWREGARVRNYRRFSDIDGLAAVRACDPRVFAAGHALLLELAAAGEIDAVRVDHVDGLLDPQRYLEQLRAGLDDAGRADAVIVVEKILTGEEELHPAWPVEGTTGYEFSAALRDVFGDPQGFGELDRIYVGVTGVRRGFEAIDHDARLRVLDEDFSAELARLCRQLEDLLATELARGETCARDLREALREVSVCLPVYRTYVRDEPVRPEDAGHLERALAVARRNRPALAEAVWQLLRAVLLLEHPRREPALAFTQRWQQLTAPLMAKGHEDTALYRYHRLMALNIVGGDPGNEPDGLPAFHRFLERRARRGAHSLNATATHDTKRGEDASARLHVLSELALDWEQQVRCWRELTRPHRAIVHGLPVPDDDMEYHLLQTLLGIWPARTPDAAELDRLRERLQQYVVKAAREAKLRTSWRRPDEAYERALQDYIAALVAPEARAGFLAAFGPFQQRVALHGMHNSLGQTLLKVAAPGVPDIYQGCELWDLSLVDPDNRRPVDFEQRRALLTRFAAVPEQDAAGHCAELLGRWRDGEVKAWVLYRALRMRRADLELLRDGDLLPVMAVGEHAGRICAFARRAGQAWCLAVVPRLLARLLESLGHEHPDGRFWGDTLLRLPTSAPATWVDALSGSVYTASGNALPAAEVLAHLPVAFLRAQG